MIVILRESPHHVTAGQMQVLPIPAFDDNYIWLLRDAAGRALVVDPGDAAPVLAALGDGSPPLAILLTHHHGDHIGGVTALLARWPATPVYAPHDDRIPLARHRGADGGAGSAAVGARRVRPVPLSRRRAGHHPHDSRPTVRPANFVDSGAAGERLPTTNARLIAPDDEPR